MTATPMRCSISSSRAAPPATPASGAAFIGRWPSPAAAPFGLRELETLLQDRKGNPQPGSYTCALLASGENRILKKVAEEMVEVVVAVKGEGRERVVSEVADLLYHTLVLLVQQGIPVTEIEAELARRHASKR